MIMFCTECGKQVGELDNFCDECGSSLAGVPGDAETASSAPAVAEDTVIESGQTAREINEPDPFLKEQIGNLPDEKLLEVLREASDYRPEAIAYAQEEVARRGGPDTLSARISTYREQELKDESAPEIDPAKFETLNQALIEDQNFSQGLIAGSMTAFICFIIWVIIADLTGYEIGFMAIGVGLAVGYTVRHWGRGVERKFGATGAGLALLCVLASTLLMESVNIYVQDQVSVFASPDVVFETIFTKPINFLFYGLAAYAGYRYSFRRIAEADLKLLRPDSCAAELETSDEVT